MYATFAAHAVLRFEIDNKLVTSTPGQVLWEYFTNVSHLHTGFLLNELNVP